MALRPFGLISPHILPSSYATHEGHTIALTWRPVQHNPGSRNPQGWLACCTILTVNATPAWESMPEGPESVHVLVYAGDIRYAILCHAPYLCLDSKSLMDNAIPAVDGLVGVYHGRSPGAAEQTRG